MASCFLNMKYQPTFHGCNVNIGRQTCGLNLNIQSGSAASTNPTSDIQILFNGYANIGLKGGYLTPEMTANVQKQAYPQRKNSCHGNTQPFERIESLRSLGNSNGQIFIPRTLFSPSQHQKSSSYSNQGPCWSTGNSLSVCGFCSFSTFVNENQSFVMQNTNLQINQQRVMRQKQYNDYYWTLPRSDPHMWLPLPTVKGTYHGSVGSNSSSGARLESRRTYAQKKFRPNRCKNPCNKLNPKKKAWKANSTKPEKITKFLYNILVKSSLFKGVYFDEVVSNAIKGMIKVMYTHDLKKGEILVRQGDTADAFFLVEYGQLTVLVEQPTEAGTETIQVAVIKAKDTFGETAVMYNTKRSATLKATQITRVWIMGSNEFNKIKYLIKDLTKKKVHEQWKFLSGIPFFARMKPHELTSLTQACHEVRFKPGDTIISRDEINYNDMYIIKQGKACLVRDRKNNCAVSRGRAVGEGEWFIRTLFQKEDLRTLIASSNVHCLKITKDDVDFLVSPYLKKYNEKHGDSHSVSDEELPKNFQNRVSYNLEDFTDIAVAGIGSFGRVKLVKAGKGSEKRVFALKEVEKNRAINTNQSEHMKNERRVMFIMDSPFIVKLFATYQDSTCVYFLLEKVLGGELFYLLRKLKSFNESMSRFYIGCVVLALEHVHSHGIVYRDLKPENLLITRSGYLKVTDFGFAKKRNQSTSLCGTPAYLAPELITGGIQNFGVDWWCLGIFLFEMLVGQVPFRDSINTKQYEDILTSSPRLPNYVTWKSQELIHGLLEKNAFKRLGSSPRGAGDIKEQCWFVHSFREDKEPFNWKRLEASQLNAPYKPKLMNDEDIRYLNTSSQRFQKNTELCRDFDPSLFQWCEEF